MFGWVYLSAERFVRSTPRRAARWVRVVPPRLIRQLAKAKLVRLLRYVYRNSPAQRERWRKAGVRSFHLHSVRALGRIPFCSADLLAREPDSFFCVPRERLTHIITTSGTSGQQKKLYFTNRDLVRQANMMGTMLCHLPGASRALATFGQTTPTGTMGKFIRRSVEEAEMFGLLVGAHLSPDEMIDVIREHGIDVVMSTPDVMHRITLEARADLEGLGVRYIILGAQPWTEKLRDELEDAWGALVLDAYGTNECGTAVACECVHKNGLHVSEVDFWVEIIDPKTERPLAPGEEGELVLTTLSRRGMPLVRYRTGDLARLLPESGRCECGFPLRKLSRIRGRIDNMLIIGGGCNVYPDQFDEAILGIPGVTDYQLTLGKDRYREVLHLTVESDERGAAVEKAMHDALMAIDGIKFSCEVTHLLEIGRLASVPRGSLSRGRPKTVRIVDQRD